MHSPHAPLAPLALLGAVLDLGCGAGALALALAAVAVRVVATTPTTATILSAVDRSPTVEEATRPLTAQGITLEAILEATRQALVTGALERGVERGE